MGVLPRPEPPVPHRKAPGATDGKDVESAAEAGDEVRSRGHAKRARPCDTGSVLRPAGGLPGNEAGRDPKPWHKWCNDGGGIPDDGPCGNSRRQGGQWAVGQLR